MKTLRFSRLLSIFKFSRANFINSFALANELIRLGKNDNINITHERLQRLIWYINGQWLLLKKYPILNTQYILLPFGYVCPKLYEETIFGNYKMGSYYHNDKYKDYFINNQYLLKIIINTYNKFKKNNDIELGELTYNKSDKYKKYLINNDEIYYIFYGKDRLSV